MTDYRTIRKTGSAGSFALCFFVVSAGVFCSAFGLAAVLIRWAENTIVADGPIFSPAFWASSTLLALCSLLQQRGLQQVRIERQRRFRRSLLWALFAGGLFVSVQTFGLWWLLQNQEPQDASTGVPAFVTVFVGLHGLHVSVAMLFLTFVFLKAFADRYDHEYHWGVTVSAHFWHALGAVWIFILAVFVIAR